MKWLRPALACALSVLAACRSYAVEFAEPAGARLKLPQRAALALPATTPVREFFPVELELEFDAATLASYGMDPQQAAELEARGQARIKGQLTVRRGADEQDLGRFALPGDLVRRAFVEHKTLRCWWPPEGAAVVRFVGAPAGDEIRHPTNWDEKYVGTHTTAQKSAEMGVAVVGALLGFFLLLAIVFSSG